MFTTYDNNKKRIKSELQCRSDIAEVTTSSLTIYKGVPVCEDFGQKIVEKNEKLPSFHKLNYRVTFFFSILIEPYLLLLLLIYPQATIPAN